MTFFSSSFDGFDTQSLSAGEYELIINIVGEARKTLCRPATKMRVFKLKIRSCRTERGANERQLGGRNSGSRRIIFQDGEVEMSQLAKVLCRLRGVKEVRIVAMRMAFVHMQVCIDVRLAKPPMRPDGITEQKIARTRDQIGWRETGKVSENGRNVRIVVTFVV